MTHQIPCFPSSSKELWRVFFGVMSGDVNTSHWSSIVDVFVFSIQSLIIPSNYLNLWSHSTPRPLVVHWWGLHIVLKSPNTPLIT